MDPPGSVAFVMHTHLLCLNGQVLSMNEVLNESFRE